ncbi:MAG: 16S rRNA (cytidine(1402)-2'-O)-methyltransferase [Armatimonadota bacterium]|nr:16S rRNA (cytidine(1402)-2'-O)-methyltransferase [Armatimonadota bacterium]MCX7778068.1 16S rRNA (cytidine(1402)-2'-O)-methyltransferase [Armatimonadota bacterium]MDW8025747.1 16S rRNA (cytidine(1402)-2'-O)-methyltransferase [Armatimonadota bacterium]
MRCNGSEDKSEKGVLYVCATPIGNLRDITLRALEVLQAVDFVIAEDTRVAKRLLNRYRIKKPLISFHEHSPKSRLHHLLHLLEDGKSLAIISDAGTPCISDPGAEIVNAALSRGYKVVPIPGPSAAIAALSVAGIRAQRFMFLGFLPRNRRDRVELLNGIKHWRHPIVIYEAPHRLVETIRELFDVLGNRRLVMARELTKQFEEIFATDLESALRRYTSVKPIGEFTLVIEGHREDVRDETAGHDNAEIDAFIRKELERGLTTREIVKSLMERFGMQRRDAYKRTIAIRESIQCSQ